MGYIPSFIQCHSKNGTKKVAILTHLLALSKMKKEAHAVLFVSMPNVDFLIMFIHTLTGGVKIESYYI